MRDKLTLLAFGAVAVLTLSSAAAVAAPDAEVTARTDVEADAVADVAEEGHADPVEAEEVDTDGAAASGLGLEVGLELASAFLWRGLNVFQDKDRMDQHMLAAPSLTWTVGETGLSVGYWGAYQLNGDNRSALIDAGVGAETDLILGYSHSVTEDFTVDGGIVYYVYPFADEAAAGAATPGYIEPNVVLSYTTVVDVGLMVGWFRSLQSELDGFNHIYINPTVGKSLTLGAGMELQLGVGLGYKVFQDDEATDNVYDVLATVGLGVELPAGLSLTPKVQAAWTNLGDAEIADELAVAGAVALGASF